MNRSNITPCLFVPIWHKNITMYFTGLITTIVIFAGCLGNIYSIWILNQVKICKVITICLVTLTCWDMGLLICAFSFYAMKALLWLFGAQAHWLDVVSRWSYGPSMTMMTGSVWMVVLITVIRYRAISKPLSQGYNEGSKIRAKIVCIFLAALAALFRIPSFFELTVARCLMENDGGDAIDWMQVFPTHLRLHPMYQLIYRVILTFIFVSIFPFLLILLLSIRMIILLRRSVKFLRTGSIRKRQRSVELKRIDKFSRNHQLMEQRTTTMLLVLMGKFLLCHTLPVMLNILEVAIGEEIVIQNYFTVLADVSNFLVIFNSATNFIVYVLWHQRKESPVSRYTVPPTITEDSPSQPVLDINERETLNEIWSNLKQKQTIETLGAELIMELVKIKPSFGIHIGISDDGELDKEMMLRIGKQVGEFLEEVLTAFAHNETIAAKRLIHTVARRHLSFGINITTEMWRKFKSFLILKALGLDDENFRDAQAEKLPDAVVWNKFLSFIVAEKKKAFQKQSQKERKKTAPGDLQNMEVGERITSV